MALINGRIIRILDRRTVVINLGQSHQIHRGDIFSILSEPEPIVDPETAEELGRVKVVKSKVAAQQVYDRFTIASTTWVLTTYQSALAPGITELLTRWGGTKEEVIDQGELRVRPEDIQPWKAQSELPVLVGDIVQVEIPDSRTARAGQQASPSQEPAPGPEETGPDVE